MQALDPGRRWSLCWTVMAAALGVHVADEALTGFLPLYNATVETARESIPWLPFPTFSFPIWLAGLTLAIATLLALTPLVRQGYRWLRPISYFLGGLMFLNGLGHIAASVWLERAAPGVYSAPVLLVASIALLVSTYQATESHRVTGGTKR